MASGGVDGELRGPPPSAPSELASAAHPRAMAAQCLTPQKASNRQISDNLSQMFRLSRESSTKEDLALEASDRPETRLELLTRISSIRFFHISPTLSPTFSYFLSNFIDFLYPQGGAPLGGEPR